MSRAERKRRTVPTTISNSSLRTQFHSTQKDPECGGNAILLGRARPAPPGFRPRLKDSHLRGRIHAVGRRAHGAPRNAGGGRRNGQRKVQCAKPVIST
jgi:hypothetical protein